MKISVNNQALKLDILKLESPYSQTVFGEIQIDVPTDDDGHFKTITLRGTMEMTITSHATHFAKLLAK